VDLCSDSVCVCFVPLLSLLFMVWRGFGLAWLVFDCADGLWCFIWFWFCCL